MGRKNHKKILLVESDETARGEVKKRLCSEGFNVCEAKSAEEGLKVAESEKPDLVISAVILPGEDGINMAKKMIARKCISKSQVMVLTNFKDAEKMVEAVRDGVIESGLSDYFVKTNCNLDDIVKRSKEKLGVK